MPKQIEFILSFEDAEQQGGVCTLEDNEATEHQFILQIGACIQFEGWNTKNLRKISACQLNATAETALPWIMASGGKYYFGPE